MECLVISGTLYHTHSSKDQDHFGSRSRRLVRWRGWGGLEGSSVFWIWQDQCTHKLSAAVVVCTRPAQDQASQHFSMERKDVISSHPRWAVVDSWWLLGKEENTFFKGMAPTILTMHVCMTLHLWVYRQHILGSLVFFKKERLKIDREWRVRIVSGKVRGRSGGEYDLKNILYLCITFSKK